ncbi:MULTISPECIES: glutathione S-transferase family protein [Sphaerospermopsis]|jgi:glutathione S-transferase|uniref:Glutathione S-transferase-like protein n=1 Tax=Sphaerospermopsis reniformis TaxID=531300 RepID=A0A479ZTG1_9CYAN|nr:MULTISPECIES: glutathione S-transferase family protein [Sphaerospermopsis]MBD2133391.1 glutathione S-transferase N-terminal domain-containing protein [Sphaerospermopsis sp. FACHB-1094]MBD2146040.1 glutathione S-transferase N-terminal domain-containing protein [Sphaerospermopsis sp. FACHB-1194]GCL35797.1 glutathione S-transferase-like protein [Sphaerospermopsis reniformis]
MAIASTTISSWEQLLEKARQNTPARRVKRPGQAPSTTPIPSSLYKLPPERKPPVLLYRDSNSWCPFCERVWFALEEKQIPFETEFIDLSNKPKWYTDLVPTTLVPAAKIEGKLVYESKDILLELEEHFGETLLPEDPEENAIARQWVEDAETNGFRDIAYKFLRQPPEDAKELANLQAEFEAKLDEIEKTLGRYPKPYFLSTFSLVDIMYSPHLDRLAANLPVYRGYHIKGNSRFPLINVWFAALKKRPAYNRVKSDNITNNLLLRRRFGIEPIGNPLPLDLAEAEFIEYRAEAAERLSDNREVAISDILKNSGVQSLGDISIIKDAVDFHLRLLADYLLNGNNELLPGGRTGGKESIDPIIAATGTITLAYIRNRICAPRDMSAGAATALRAAADKVFASIY